MGGGSPSWCPPTCGPPCLVYLVAAWDPWNWAAVAVSQELLPEAERDVRPEVSGCSPELGTEGNAPACPGFPPDHLGPLMASPRPLLLPAGWGGPRAAAVSSSWCYGKLQHGWVSMGASSLGEEPRPRRCRLGRSVYLPEPRHTLAGPPATPPSEAALLPPSLLPPKLQLMQFRPNPVSPLPRGEWRCNSFYPQLPTVGTRETH